MKKLLFIFLLLSSLTLSASSDTSILDTFCFVDIGIQPAGSGLQLTAFAFDFIDPNATFSYLWSTGDTSQNIPLINDGIYCITATSNSTGCVTANCITVNVQDCELNTWYAQWSEELYAFSSGLPPYQYQWDNGETTSFINASIGDSYCVTVTDAFGCTADTCGIVEGVVDTFCFADIYVFADSSGDIILNALGGGVIFPPNGPTLSYLWSTGDTTASIIATTIAEYCVTVTMSTCTASSCLDLGEVECDVFIGCDPPGTFSAFSLGVYPFTYEWNTGDTTQQIPVNVGETYCVTITDALGCMSDTCMTADSVAFPPALCWTWIVEEVYNNDIHLIANGFSFFDSLASYVWSTGDTTMSIIGLPGETYCVTVTYADSCVAIACTEVEAFDCSNLYVLCDPGGTIGVLSGGLPPFTYLWNTGETTEFIIGETDSTYCVTITDAANCIADTCITVMEFPPDTFNFPASIYGYIYDGDSTVLSDYFGWVYLYEKDLQGDFNLVDSTPIEGDLLYNGYFFDDVADGEYLAKAVATAIATGKNYIPTYHFSTMEWSEADIITVDGSNPTQPWVTADIMLLGTTPLNGPGTINGVITDINNLVGSGSRNGSGLAGVTIILTDQADQPFAYFMTTATGEFSFDNLPYGTYHVHADYINLTGPYAVVTIGPGSEDVVLSFEVDDNNVFLDNKTVDLSSELNVFPNPATDRIFITTTNDIVVKSIIVSNLQGKRMLQLTNLPVTGIEINTSGMNQGIHLIQLVTDRGILNQKIMIIN